MNNKLYSFCVFPKIFDKQYNNNNIKYKKAIYINHRYKKPKLYAINSRQ